MMACEASGRKAFQMEIDPPYCDVIVQRSEAFTGKKAKLEKSGLEKANDKAPAKAGSGEAA